MPGAKDTARPQRFALEAIDLDETAGEPLYRQLEAGIRAAIQVGRLRPGERLPSTRQLARDLGVARNTVVNAYGQLIIEGYLAPTAGSGTRVATPVPDGLLQAADAGRASSNVAKPPTLSAAAHRLFSINAVIADEVDRPSRPFRAHTPASDAFPRRLWAQLVARRLRTLSRSWMDRADPRGYRPLREAIAGYLGSSRGVTCDADQVMVTAGAQQAINLIAQLLIDPGDTVCIEDPGYVPAATVFELAGARIVPIPVDDEGIDVEALKAHVPRAKLVFVTPASQFPLCKTMSLARRLALLDWAERAGATILEDDCSGEYRYAGRPLQALHGLAPAGRVLYVGTFSKLLFPTLRLGYAVVPDGLVDHVAAARWLIDQHSPPLEQAVVADFIDEGHFARHVRRMRALYAERQAALVAVAADELGAFLDVPALDTGLHLVGWPSSGFAEHELAVAAASAGLEQMPLSWFGLEQPKKTGLILGYAPFAENELRRAAARFRQAIER